MERHIVFERCRNFRDFGGYETLDGRRVRWRRLFRSMTPEFMTRADLVLARDELGIRTVIDFRGRYESSGPLANPPVRRAVIDFDWDSTPDGLPPERFFQRFTRANGHAIARAIAAITTYRDGAVLLHCSVGRDRTGIVCAALLKLLGVDDEDVVQDYMHSVDGFTAAQELRMSMGYDPYYSLTRGRPGWALKPPEESWIRAILESLEAAGGADTFVLASGVPAEMVQRFRDWALEDGEES